MSSETDQQFVERISLDLDLSNTADIQRLFALARRGAAVDEHAVGFREGAAHMHKAQADRIAQLEAALRPFACECVGFCKDAKHNYGEVDPVDTCGYGRARAALEERT